MKFEILLDWHSKHSYTQTITNTTSIYTAFTTITLQCYATVATITLQSCTTIATINLQSYTTITLHHHLTPPVTYKGSTTTITLQSSSLGTWWCVL